MTDLFLKAVEKAEVLVILDCLRNLSFIEVVIYVYSYYC